MGIIVRRLLKKSWARTAALDRERLAAQTPLPSVRVIRNLPYAGDGNPMHLLNLYMPQDAQGLLPVIIDIHGGGWMYGDKDLNRQYDMFMASKGYVVAAMSYRLLPETNLCGQVQDVYASLHWLGAHGAAYHCDLSRVFLTGDSVGGHLSGLAACIQQSSFLQGLYGVQPFPFAIRAIAISHGVCDIHEPAFVRNTAVRRVGKEILRMLLGRRLKRSPFFNHSSFRQTAEGLTLPPIRLISSEADPLHPQSVSLRAYLAASGRVHEARFWTRQQGEKLGHVFHVMNPEWPESEQTNLETLAFFSASEQGGQAE